MPTYFMHARYYYVKPSNLPLKTKLSSCRMGSGVSIPCSNNKSTAPTELNSLGGQTSPLGTGGGRGEGVEHTYQYGARPSAGGDDVRVGQLVELHQDDCLQDQREGGGGGGGGVRRWIDQRSGWTFQLPVIQSIQYLC